MPGSELFGAEERKEVNDVLESGMLFRYNHDDQRNGHWKARDFEAALADFNKVKYAHTTTSGSTAVAVAMAACGIGAGDEVIVPPFTYVATVEGALLGGALPVFAEIDETLCLSPEGIRKVITPKTKAIVLVHMCGSMAKIDEIMEICEEHNIHLIEDTAQALGATHNGKPAGTFGKMGCFSFDFFKIITCGEGGAIITNDQKLYENAAQFSDHGHDHIGDNRGAEKHPVVGFNYRMGEINAGIGLAQIRKMDYILSQQRKHKKALKECLSKYDGITFRHIEDEAGDAGTFMDFFLADVDKTKAVVKALQDEKVGEFTGIQYWYENGFHYFKNWDHIKDLKFPMKVHAHTVDKMPQDFKTLELPKTDDLISRLISLVVKITWTDEDLKTLISRIDAALSKTLS